MEGREFINAFHNFLNSFRCSWRSKTKRSIVMMLYGRPYLVGWRKPWYSLEKYFKYQNLGNVLASSVPVHQLNRQDEFSIPNFCSILEKPNNLDVFSDCYCPLRYSKKPKHQPKNPIWWQRWRCQPDELECMHINWQRNHLWKNSQNSSRTILK